MKGQGNKGMTKKKISFPTKLMRNCIFFENIISKRKTHEIFNIYIYIFLKIQKNILFSLK